LRESRRGRLSLESLEDRLAPAVSTWTGAVSGLWSQAGNWDVAPNPGDELVFPDGAANKTNTNDLAAGTAFQSISLTGSGYAISGNAVDLGGSISASYASGNDDVNLPINFTAPGAVDVATAGASLSLGGVLSGSGGLNKQGAGELDLSAANTYTGATTVSGGVLNVNGSLAGSPVTVSSGATLGGTGTVQAITSNSGAVKPGDPAPGILTDATDATFDSGSSFAVALNGDTAGTGYSQLKVGGTLNLNGATLNATLGYSPTGNAQYTLIDVDGSAAVNGTFNGLAEGAVTTISGQPFRISYVGGTGNDVVLTHLIGTTTTVAASPSNPNLGQTVTLTATVSPSGGSGTPTGTVQFFSGTTSLGTATLSAGGTAVLATTGLTLGANAVTAKYLGDTSFGESTSPEVNVPVAQGNSTTTVVASAASSVSGQPVTFTATVKASGSGTGTPTGNVIFFNGSQPIGTAALAGGAASITTSTLPIGTATITAKYQGDSDFTPSDSSPISFVVAQAATTVTLTPTPATATPGVAVTLTASILITSPGTGTPTGTVEFFNGTTSLGTATVSSGVASIGTTTLPIGTNSITARYSGDANFQGSTSPAVGVVISASTTTVTTTSSAPTSVIGQAVTFTATVAAGGAGVGTPAGTVQFLDGTTVIGTGVLEGGKASFTTSSLPVGAHTITVKYSGDSKFQASTSTPFIQTVNAQTTLTQLLVSPRQSALGEAVTLTATVAVVAPGTGTAGGSVAFYSNDTLLGIVPLTNGTATLTTSNLPVGSSILLADYLGDNVNAPSTSQEVIQTVGNATQLYLNQIYLDILHRPIDDASLQRWSNALAKGRSRISVVNAIMHSTEARTVAVQTVYQAYLGREATPTEVSRAIKQSKAYRNDLRVGVLSSREYIVSHGMGNSDAYVVALGYDVLGTQTAPATFATLIGRLSGGATPTTVVLNVLNSTPAYQAFVVANYSTYLHRVPTANELARLVDEMSRGASTRTVLAQLLASQEYYNQVTTIP